MSEKRKDKKGRLLREGESQRSDGRYMYRYTDVNGDRKTEYSWRLTETDPHPKGKKKDLSLREKEETIKRDCADYISYTAGKMTLNELFDLYLEIKERKKRTKDNYVSMWDKNVRNRAVAGGVEIRSLRKHHIISLYKSMLEDDCGNGTIIFIGKIINAMLNYACEEDYIRKNYAKGCVQELNIYSAEREALTIEQQTAFLKYVVSNKKYRDSYWMFVFMLETACRGSELAGLTSDDLNMDKKFWNLDHQLLFYDKKFYISPPKTRKGIRNIPLSSDAINAIKRQKELLLRKGMINNHEVDSCNRFLFLTPTGKLWQVDKMDVYIHRIIKNYNKEETVSAEKEEREPFLLPDFTSHILRHTGCTRMAEAGMDARTLQDVMGHASIKITMKVYNHVDDVRLRTEIEKLDKIKKCMIS